MPRCFVQATPRVQQYLLRTGVETALDLAGWWSSFEEVRLHGTESGWDEADLIGAEAAWSESRRPEIRSLPGVPVPAELRSQPAATLVCPTTMAQMSLDSLRQVDAAPPPDMTDVKTLLRDFFFKLGPQGSLWDPDDPIGQ